MRIYRRLFRFLFVLLAFMAPLTHLCIFILYLGSQFLWKFFFQEYIQSLRRLSHLLRSILNLFRERWIFL